MIRWQYVIKKSRFVLTLNPVIVGIHEVKLTQTRNTVKASTPHICERFEKILEVVELNGLAQAFLRIRMITSTMSVLGTRTPAPLWTGIVAFLPPPHPFFFFVRSYR